MSERTRRTKPGTKRGVSALTLVAAAAVALLLTFNADTMMEAAEEWETYVFHDAAFEFTELEESPVVSALSLLDEAGFDADEIAVELLTSGVPAQSFALANYSPFELAGDQKAERTCLALAIYHEARNQSVVGRFAVADVILNRVEDRRFPSSICEVIYQGRGKSYACQFSFACDGSLDRPREPKSWARSRALANIIYRGFRPPVTGLATFYHAEYVKPYWSSAFDRTRTIGDHVFYRPPGAVKLAANRLGVELIKDPNS